jgi:sialidase-1
MFKTSIEHIIVVFVISFLAYACSNQPSKEALGKEIVLKLTPSHENPRNSEGDFIQLKDGSILFVYTYFTEGTSDNAKAHLAGRFSYDDGQTWTEEDVIIIANEGEMNTMSVSLLRLKGGKIALFYLRKNSETDCIPFMRISSDEAKSWSEPIRCLPTDGYHVVNNDRLLQLQNERLIYPTALHTTPDWKYGTVFSYYSDDLGKTWNQSQQVPNPKNIVLQEPGIVALGEDKLMLFCRTESGVQYVSFSENQGQTWSEIEPSTIRSPLSPASIKRIPETGDLILVWNNNYTSGRDAGKRTPYNLAISKDDGKSWGKVKTIESDPAGWYCYTAISFTDTHILLGYCAGNTKINNGLSTTHITRLSMEWIYKDTTSNPFVISDSDKVVLGCKDENTQIRYTLDGSLPSETSGTLYKNPISITKIALLNMVAYTNGKIRSGIVSTQIGSHIFQNPQQIPHKLKQGIEYQYFIGKFNRTNNFNTLEPIRQGSVSNFSLLNNSSDENFGYIFKGYIKIPKDGHYTFYLTSNDGSKLYLNDQLVIDNDGAHGVSTRDSAASLRKGFHKIRIAYFQAGGGKELRVSWKEAGLIKEEIPETNLFQ